MADTPTTVTRGVTFINNDTAIRVDYTVKAEFSAEIPLDELPFDVESVYDANEATTHEEKLDALADEIDSDVEGVLQDYTDLDNAPYITYELDTTPVRQDTGITVTQTVAGDANGTTITGIS